MKLKLKHLFFYMVPVLVLLLLGEIFLRLVHFDNRLSGKSAIVCAYRTIRNAREGVRYIVCREHRHNATIRQETSKEYRANVNNAREEYFIQTDSLGFILPSFVHADPDLTMVFLGGSTTECFMVDDSLRFPYKAGRLLEKLSGKKINSLNSGIGGNNSFHSIDLLINKIIPIKPDIAVMMHNVNDWATFLFLRSYWNDNSSRALIVNLQKKGEVNEWSDPRYTKPVLDTSSLLTEFRRAQQLFVSTCKIYHIMPVLMTQASRFKDNPDPDLLALINPTFNPHGISYAQVRALQVRLNSIVREVAEENNIPLVDLEKEVGTSVEMMYDLVHLTNAGSQKAARAVATTLLHELK